MSPGSTGSTSAVPAVASRNQPSEPYPTAPIILNYPVSSQRTQMHDVQVASSHQGHCTADLSNNSHDVILSDAGFSPVPASSDPPPPPCLAPAPHSFPNRFPQQSHPASAPNHPAQASSFSTRLAHSFPDRKLPIDRDGKLIHARSHCPLDFISIVTTAGSSANYGAQQSSPSFSPSLPIETMASPGENPPGKTSMTKSHTCRVCFKTFSRPSNLGTHMNMHNDVRPYACGFPGCPKMFSVRSNAQRHFRLHDETAPTPPPPPTAAVGRLEWRELQLMPELPPLPLHSLSQAPARFRWAPPNSKHYSPTFLGAEEGGGGTVPSGSAQGGNLARLTTCMTTHGVRGKPPVALPTTE